MTKSRSSPTDTWCLAPWVRPDSICEACKQPIGGSWERGTKNPAWLKPDPEQSSCCIIANHVRCVHCDPEAKEPQ